MKFLFDSVIPGILIGIISSRLGFTINEWQWWVFVMLATLLSFFIVNYLRKVK